MSLIDDILLATKEFNILERFECLYSEYFSNIQVILVTWQKPLVPISLITNLSLVPISLIPKAQIFYHVCVVAKKTVAHATFLLCHNF